MSFNRKGGTLLLLLFLGLNSLLATRYYVDGTNGNNSWNGLFDTYQGFGTNGPKKTIGAALAIAVSGDNIEIAGGNYPECLTITKSVNVILNSGNVTVKCILVNGLNIALNLSSNTVNTDLAVSDSLSLWNGRIEDTDPKLNLVALESCAVRGGNKKSYIDNRLWRETSKTTNTAIYYPVGSGPDFRPVTMDFKQSTATTNRYMIECRTAAVGGIPGPGIRNISRVHFWGLRFNGSATPSDYKLTLNYDSTVNDDQCPQPSTLRIVRQMGGVIGPWINIGGTGSAPYIGKITNTVKLDTIGRFTLGNIITGTNPLGRKGPIVHFGWTGNCEKTTVTFKDSSFSYKLPILRRSWYFGTGNTADTSNLTDPSFVFPSVGPFFVRLIVYNADGADTLVRRVFLRPRPVASFSSNNVCFGTPIPFTSTSTLAGPDTILTYKWDMGNSTSRAVKKFTYSYPSAGNYDVKLIVTGPFTCADTITKKITVNGKPSPNFTVSKICLGETTEFKGSGGNVSDTITSWKYSIDGSFSAGSKDFTEELVSAKNYDIELSVISQLGCKDTVKKQITIYRVPTPNFYLSGITKNDSIQCFEGNKFTFINGSKTYQSQVLTSSWFYQSPFITGSNIISTSKSGNLPVKLIIKSDKGCLDSLTKSYFVRDDIKVKYGVASYCLPTPADFTDSSTAGSQTINSWLYKFGDGNTKNTKNSSNTYLTGGTYNSKLVIGTTDGCIDSITVPVLITSKPTISLNRTGSNPFCNGDSLIINVSGGNNVKWMDNDTNRKRVIKNSGFYKVTAFTSAFCSVSDSITTTKHPAVFADAGLDTFVIKGRSMFLVGDGGQKYEWTPRNLCETPDSSKTKVKPSVKTKYYLKVIDFTGCIGNDSVEVDVREPDFIRIPNLITPNNDNKNDEWDLREIPDVETCVIQIFTERGNLVKTIKNYKHDWKGSNETGTTLPNGGYYYIIKCPGEKEPFKGYLHIMK